jgi:hypothetical protein
MVPESHKRRPPTTSPRATASVPAKPLVPAAHDDDDGGSFRLFAILGALMAFGISGGCIVYFQHLQRLRSQADESLS